MTIHDSYDLDLLRADPLLTEALTRIEAYILDCDDQVEDDDA